MAFHQGEGRMKVWSKPSVVHRRFGFEINLYIKHR